MASLPSRAGAIGHEGFVAPSSYLRPQAPTQSMPSVEQESVVERDQRLGLVSAFNLSVSVSED